MTHRSVRDAGLVLALAALLGACSPSVAPSDVSLADSATEGSMNVPDTSMADAAADTAAAIDAPAPPNDSAPDGGPRVRCVMGCDDGEACTIDRCGADGFCQNIVIASCPGCRSDGECDDGNADTMDQCNPLTRFCGHQRRGNCASLSGPDCDDGDACTIDNCNFAGECTQGPNYGCCHYDAMCDDGNPCTTDRCQANTCVRTPVMGCVDPSCPDLDGDGARSNRCGGDDCDDLDRARNPRATELCSDRIDNNCNMLVDGSDPACRPANATCATALALAHNTSVTGRIPSSPERTGSCSAVSAYYALTLREPSDVQVELTLVDTPADTVPPCRDCPLRGAPMTYSFAAFLRSMCDATTVVDGTPTRCNDWFRSTLFPLMPHRYERQRLPAGTYFIDVQASADSRNDPRGVEYALRANVFPVMAPACATAPLLVEGPAVRASTAGGADAFTARCDNAVERARERLFRIDLAEPRRVTITARPTAATQPIRVGIYSACDATAPRVSCVETSGSSSCATTNTTYAQLPAGAHWVVVEPRGGGDAEFDLSYTSEPATAACASATTIRASGSFMGTTAGGMSRFSATNTCGAGEGPDVAYVLSISARSRVVLDLVAGYSNAQLRVLRGCAGAVVASGTASTPRVDTMLEPGEYTVVVDGDTATSAGSFVLNATVLAL